jgi:hypothetical protein
VLWKSVPARNIEWDWTSYPTIRDWRTRSRSFEDLAVMLRPEGSFVTLESEVGPEKIQAAKVTGNFFDVLGVAPLPGRSFSQSESMVVRTTTDPLSLAAPIRRANRRRSLFR